jgi:hypothetical protein
MKSLQQPEGGKQATRHISDDRHLTVARLVNYDAAVAIQAANPVTVALVLRVEDSRDATDVELQPRGDGFDELIYPLPLER